MSFNERYWSVVLGKTMWLNPLWLAFVVLGMGGAVLSKDEMSMPQRIVTMVIGLVGILAIIGLPIAIYQHNRPSHQPKDKERVA
jgi:hypothetical protein